MAGDASDDPADPIQQALAIGAAALDRHGVRFDWLRAVLPAYRHVLDRATLEAAEPTPLRVATTEGLILLKLLAFRLQDQTDIEALVAANRTTLDLAWIQSEWQAIFPLEDPRMRWLVEQVDSPSWTK